MYVLQCMCKDIRNWLTTTWKTLKYRISWCRLGLYNMKLLVRILRKILIHLWRKPEVMWIPLGRNDSKNWYFEYLMDIWVIRMWFTFIQITSSWIPMIEFNVYKTVKKVANFLNYLGQQRCQGILMPFYLLSLLFVV